MNGSDFPVLVSVLIPLFNHEDFIEQAIKSVENQTYPNIELLVLDDGSSDTSYKKALEALSRSNGRFVRVAIWQQVNSGVSVTLNNLVKESQGRYILILASDDTLVPCAVQELVGALNSNPLAVLAVGDNAFIDSNGNHCMVTKGYVTCNSKTKGSYSTLGNLLGVNSKKFQSRGIFGSHRHLMFRNHVPNGYLIRRNVMMRTGGYDEKIFLEDWYIMLQLSKFGKFIYLSNQKLLNYRIHGENTVLSTSFRDKQRSVALQICKYEFTYCLTNNELFFWIMAVIKTLVPAILRRAINKCYNTE